MRARVVVGRFLDCGLLGHGFARVRCSACRAEFLVAFRCKGRGFCPSCQARRLAEWSLRLDEQLFAAVAHRHLVLTVPKRLRPCFLHDRRRLGLLSRTAYRTLHANVGAAIAADDRAAVLRVARYGARAPGAESRLRYYSLAVSAATNADQRPTSAASGSPGFAAGRCAPQAGSAATSVSAGATGAMGSRRRLIRSGLAA